MQTLIDRRGILPPAPNQNSRSAEESDMIASAPRNVILAVGLTTVGLVTNFSLSVPTFAVAVAQSEARSGPPAMYPGYELIWADEFDRGGEPTAKNWTYERGFVRNRELQWYRPENARVSGGLLTI